MKVLCDELFGRKKFIASLVWNYEGNTDNTAKIINYHEYILVYSKTGIIDDPAIIDPNISLDSKLFNEEIRNTIIKNGIKNPPVKVLIPKGFPCSFSEGIIKMEDVQFPKYSADIYVCEGITQNDVYAVTGWSSRALLEKFIANGCCEILDSKGQNTVFEMKSTGAIEAVKKRKSSKGHVVSVLRGFGTTNQMRLLLEKMGLKFSYPKPVNLIKYLIEAFSADNDIILDSFAGSGTTAHAILELNREKSENRKFIMVEMESGNINQVIVPRINYIIDGYEKADIKEHGGGYKFYEIAEPLLVKNPILPIYQINPSYTWEMVCEAICKIEGFTYAPSGEFQGYSSESRFIHITEEFVNTKYVMSIMKTLGEHQSLLIYCKKNQADMILPENVEVKKMPKDLLEKCSFVSEVQE